MLHQSAWWNNAALHHVAVRGAWACTVPTPHLLLSDALSAASRFQLRLSHLPSQSETPCLVCFLLQPFFFLSLCPPPLSVDLHSVCLSLPDTHTHAHARAQVSLLPDSSSLTHMCSHCFRHSDYNSSVPDPLCLSRSLSPSHPISSTQQGGAEPLWCCCCCCVSLRPFQGMMGYLRGGSRLWEGTIWKEYHVTL